MLALVQYSWCRCGKHHVGNQQLQLVANVMWVLTCRCMIRFRLHDDLIWGFDIFRSRPTGRVQVCVEGHTRGTLADGLPLPPLAALLRPPHTPRHTCSSRNNHSNDTNRALVQTKHNMYILYKPDLCRHPFAQRLM